MDSCLQTNDVDCLWDSLNVPERAIATAILRNEYLPLATYSRQAWRVVEPGTPYIHNWHIDAICEHLEAVTRQQIKNLIVNIPPRHMKSLLVAVFWPTWWWTFQPSVRFLFASYAEPLAIRDALKSRRIIQSEWYQQRWGHRFQLAGDQNQKKRYENDHTGFRVATGVDGVATGEGGDVLVVDDPHKAKGVESAAQRQNVTEWWDKTWSTRGPRARKLRCARPNGGCRSRWVRTTRGCLCHVGARRVRRAPTCVCSVPCLALRTPSRRHAACSPRRS